MIYGQDKKALARGCGEFGGVMRVGGECESPLSRQVVTATHCVILPQGKVTSRDRELARVPDEFEIGDVSVEVGRFIYSSGVRVEYVDDSTVLVAHRHPRSGRVVGHRGGSPRRAVTTVRKALQTPPRPDIPDPGGAGTIGADYFVRVGGIERRGGHRGPVVEGPSYLQAGERGPQGVLGLAGGAQLQRLQRQRRAEL